MRKVPFHYKVKDQTNNSLIYEGYDWYVAVLVAAGRSFGGMKGAQLLKDNVIIWNSREHVSTVNKEAINEFYSHADRIVKILKWKLLND